VFGVSIELTDSVKKLFKETASQLKGAARRRFQAQIVMELGTATITGSRTIGMG
jgi:hypothetical protein